jgi:hypothetical protein
LVGSSPRALARRKTLEQYPPFSGEVICCLTGIPGESRDSGRGSGLDAEAKSAVLSPCQERFFGQCREGLPDSRSGRIMGDSCRDVGPSESVIPDLVRTTFKCPIAGLACRSCMGRAGGFQRPGGSLALLNQGDDGGPLEADGSRAVSSGTG